jgi:hypothetical protein
MTLVTPQLVDAFFNTGFEEPFTVHLESGAVNIQSHYYDKYLVAKMLDIEVSSSYPMLECKTSDIPGVKQKDLVVGRETEFYVSEVQPDGEGFTNLTLYYGND